MLSKIKTDGELLHRIEQKAQQLDSSRGPQKREMVSQSSNSSGLTLTCLEICLTLIRCHDSIICLWDRGELRSWQDVDVAVRRFWVLT